MLEGCPCQGIDSRIPHLAVYSGHKLGLEDCTVGRRGQVRCSFWGAGLGSTNLDTTLLALATTISGLCMLATGAMHLLKYGDDVLINAPQRR